ncbi:MAG: trimethylamine methyltransferase family protein, partial [Deltaproteobacteria bacterium]
MSRKESTSRRPRRAAPEAAAVYRGPHDATLQPYDPLGTATADLLIDAALELLAESGVGFEVGSEALSILRAGGCEATADGIVRMERDLVRSALASTAKSTKLWDRTATGYIELDCHHTWFIPGMTCIRVFDLDSGEPRDSNSGDLATIARLADALPNIDAVCVACKDVEHSDIHGEIGEFATMAAN